MIKRWNKIFLLGLLCLCWSCRMDLPKEVAIAYNHLPQHIDFNYQVKPILSDKCFACHGPDANNRKADLRLDLPQEEIIKEFPEAHSVITDGKPQQSELVQRILTTASDQIMPPPESHLSLTPYEKAVLIKWVKEGADYQPHWSFIPPTKNDAPTITQKDWPQNAIDYFVLNKLEQQDWSPQPKASKETLIRRASFGLTGLPPTIADMKDYANDPSEDAFEKVIDRLLASPAYGERMATYWMDVARYADSDGYLDDKHRDFSPWRDWVIDAFNQNMPYDQFGTWQLAGDQIPEKNKQSILATAFNRLHRKNSEAGIVFEEFRAEYVADRTITLGKTFMGLTLECARCHDHKYDPISQEDFYQLFAFFNSTDELGTAVYGPDQTPGPAMPLSSSEQDRISEFLAQLIDQQQQQINTHIQHNASSFNQWIQQPQKIATQLAKAHSQAIQAYLPFDQFHPSSSSTHLRTQIKGHTTSYIDIKEPNVQEGYRGNGLFIDDYTQLTLPEKVGWFDRAHPFSISLALYPDTLYKEAMIFSHCENLRLGLKGYSLFLDQHKLRFVIAHSWPQNALQVSTTTPLPIRQWSHITITYDGSSQADGIKLYVNGSVVPMKKDLDHLYKDILFKPDIHTYGFQGFTIGKRDKMILFDKGGIDELAIFERKLTELEVRYHYNKEEALALLDSPLSDSNQPILKQFFDDVVDDSVQHFHKTLREQRKQWNHHWDSIPEIMVMKDVPTPRPTYILERGSYDAPAQEVSPGVPESVMPYDSTLPPNRTGLSKWLFHPQNPLTARVFVNRIWKMHFGRGLVHTLDDFGNQGDLPSHPYLLDWLAVTFIESGWDIKHLHKLILMSATYQQHSKVDESILTKDPENVLLARGPRIRMSAEMIRDNALAISELLSSNLGGRSVYPYQPAGLWDEISNKSWRYKYLQEPGEGLYRRSLYTIWKRTSPPPSMLIFDAPDRSVCTVDRRPTSTPLQALVLLNDPQFLEAARVTAEHLLEAYPNQLSYQLESAFLLATGRTAHPAEVTLLLQYYQKELGRFQADVAAAQAYINIGEYAVNESLDPAKTAALATVINGIMNTSEGYTIQ